MTGVEILAIVGGISLWVLAGYLALVIMGLHKSKDDKILFWIVLLGVISLSLAIIFNIILVIVNLFYVHQYMKGQDDLEEEVEELKKKLNNKKGEKEWQKEVRRKRQLRRG